MRHSSMAMVRFLGAVGILAPACTPGGAENPFEHLRPEDFCDVMLDGTATISVAEPPAPAQTCVATGACAFRQVCPAGFCGPVNRFSLAVYIQGYRQEEAEPDRPCAVAVSLALTDQGQLATPRQTFDLSMLDSPDALMGLIYQASYYSEIRSGPDLDPPAYPAPDPQLGGARLARWSGAASVESLPQVGGLVRGTLDYDGEDAMGRRRVVDAAFTVVRYGDEFPPSLLDAVDAGAW
jgi:hypothetical protein